MTNTKKLDKKDVKRIAKLANLPLSDQEIVTFTPQLSEVIEYFNLLDEVDIKGVEPTFHPSGKQHNKFQEQLLSAQTLDHKDALVNAPKTDKGFVVAKSKLRE